MRRVVERTLVVAVAASCGRLDFGALAADANAPDASDIVPGADAAACGVVSLDLEAYALGTVNAQDGWSSLGAAGEGCAVYDHEVAANTYGVLAFGTKSLRVSDAVTSTCFADQTFVKPTPDCVGESSADATNVACSAQRRTQLDAQWSFASTSAAQQSGLAFEADLDQGQGARMAYVGFSDDTDGLDLTFYDYEDVPPYGAVGDETDGCSASDGFVMTPIATGLSRTAPHVLRLVLDAIEGPRNDVVAIYVDDALVHTGTSWEDYYRWCNATDVSEVVDTVMFRTGGSAAPPTDGGGLVMDNFTLKSCN